MIYFTNYANNKFELLNRHKVFITKEQVEDSVLTPEKLKKQGKFLGASKEGIKVIYKKENDIIKIITFFPIKS